MTTMFILISCSAILNIYRVHKEETEPALSTWSLLFLISLSMLVSYASSDGTRENIRILVLELIEPAIVFFLIIQKVNGKKIPTYEKFLIAVTVGIIVVWAIVSYVFPEIHLSNTLLYMSVLTEVSALVGQFIKNCLQGSKDRPLHWIISGLGYLLSMCLIPSITLPNLALPFLGILYLGMAVPLIVYRVKNKIPFRKWA